MKTAEEWTKEQFGIWEHGETKHAMGVFETSACNLQTLIEQIQLDAMKEGMRRAAVLCEKHDDEAWSSAGKCHSDIMLAAEQLTEKDLA